MDFVSGTSERLLAVPAAASIGRYRLIAELGSGGMANVFLAIRRGPHSVCKLVVLKVPRESVTDDPSLLGMFLDEARLATRLNHHNVVQTYEVIEEDGRDVIVMEYLDGQTFNEVLARSRRKGKPLPIEMQLRIVADALQGLHYAHEARDYDGKPLAIVHRDMSPHNIFITFDGQVKVLDFGIAKAATSMHVTQAGTFKGKVRYMPPEQFTGEDVDRRADLFAVGAVLWEVIVGHKLWKGRPDTDVVSNVIAGTIPSVRDVVPDVDPTLEAIVRRALACDRDERYATALELRKDLETYLDGLSKRVTTTEVGAFVADLFAESRAQRQKMINEQVARGDEDEGYRVLTASELPGRPSFRGAYTPTNPTALSSERPPSPSVSPALIDTPFTPPKRSRFLLAAAAMTAFGVGAVAFMRAPQSTIRYGGRAVEDREVRVTFVAKPETAILVLDGHPLPTNPHTAHVPRDGSKHTLRVEAKDHVTKSFDLVYESDKEIVVSLEHTPR